MHAAEFLVIRVRNEEVETLALTDVGAAIGRHVDQCLLLHLPHRLEDPLDVLGHPWEALDGAVVSNDRILHLSCPEAALKKGCDQVLVDDDKFTGERATGKDMGRVRLDTLTVSKDLAC